MLIDHDNGRVLEVLEDREKATLVRWLQQAKAGGLLAELKEVTTDMWEGYEHAVREVFGPGVRIVVDRFHVMKLFQDQLTLARRELQSGLSKQERELLKGSRWLWVSNDQSLSERRRKEFSKLRQRFPQLKKLWLHRRRLRRIFEDRTLTDPQEAKRRLQAWCEQGRRLGLAALAKFGQTMGRWIDGIANYFVSRSSNGRTEGFNHGIRAILWRAFGMRNFTHFRLRVLHAFG